MNGCKWVVLTLCCLCLAGCGKTQEAIEPVFEPQPVVSQQVPAEEPEPLPEPEFLLLVGGQPFEGGCLDIGGRAYVEWEAAAKSLGAAQKPQVTAGVGGREYVNLQTMCEENGLALLSDPEAETYIIVQEQPWEIPEGYDVPVLMYHGVSDDMWGMTELFVKPAMMEAQIQYLLENGYTPIWFEDLPNVDKIEKPVILTYDDGYMDNYLELYPILQKYQVKATIFVVTGAIDYNPRSVTSAQIKEMSDSGLVSIQSHTVTHPLLAGLSPEQQEYELTQSKLTLASITGKEPSVICYPSGSYDVTTLELAERHYSMGIDMNGNLYRTGNDPYQVQRFYIRRQDGLGTFAAYIQ